MIVTEDLTRSHWCKIGNKLLYIDRGYLTKVPAIHSEVINNVVTIKARDVTNEEAFQAQFLLGNKLSPECFIAMYGDLVDD